MSALTVFLLALAAAPQVSSVVVYPDRATVTRSQQVACSGTTTVTFEAIPPAADASSVRAKGIGASVGGVTTREEILPAAFSSEQEALEKQRQKLDQDIGAEQQSVARSRMLASAGARYGELALQDIATEMTEAKPNLRAWSSALDTSLQSRINAAVQAVASAARIRELERKRDEVARKLALLAPASQTQQRHADVIVSCASGNATVELSYTVGGARWEPIYEARVDEGASRLELTFQALVMQATGEEWKGAAVVLSTAVPSDNATPPELVPLKVYAHEQKEKKKVLVRRDEERAQAEAGGMDDGPAFQGQVRPASQGLSVQLEVPGKSEVPGDGRAVRLIIGRHKMAAKVVLRSVPKLLPVVFRVAEATNSAPFPLMPGRIEVFGRSGYLGVQHQERVAQGAPLKVTMGTEDKVKLERVVVEELKKSEGFFNSRRRFRYAYRFELTHHGPKAETVELSEHIPVSELDDVLVEVEKDKTTGGYEHKAAEGILQWKVALNPGEKKTVELAFHVDVPSSYESAGL